MGIFGLRSMMEEKIKSEKGQAMVEMALVLPILLLILCGIIDFGWMFYNQLTLDNVCREGARYAVVNTQDDCGTDEIEEHIENAITRNLNNVSMNITYSVPTDPTSGDVTVYLKADFSFLTPILGMVLGGQEKTLTSAVVMKVES